MKNIFSLIKESLYNNNINKPSSSRIMAYLMMFVIFLNALIYFIIEIVNLINSLKKDETYVIPTEHIIILGMFLTHQLSLLGIYKYNEVKINTKNGSNIQTNLNTTNTNQTATGSNDTIRLND